MIEALADYEFPQSVPFAVRRAMAGAEELMSAAEVERAVDQLAVRLTAELQQSDPVLLSVLHGGGVITGMLSRRLIFPLQLGYVHVSRYRDATSGGELEWHASATPDLTGRTVLLVDDILDEGATLAALYRWAQGEGAARVLTAVLVRRERRQQAIQTDFAAIATGPGFIIGSGMDFQGYGRNLPGLYVLQEED